MKFDQLKRHAAARDLTGDSHYYDAEKENWRLRSALRELLSVVGDREYPVSFGEFLDDIYPAVDNARRVFGEVTT